MCGVSNNAVSFAQGVNVRDREERDSNDVLSCPHYPLQGDSALHFSDSVPSVATQSCSGEEPDMVILCCSSSTSRFVMSCFSARHGCKAGS